jgi:hypothetical protein
MGGEQYEFAVALLAFLSMIGAAFLGLFIGKTRPAERLQDNTSTVVELLAGLFVVMTSLVLGFMINSAKDTSAANDRNIHTLATDIILLDRTMQGLGQEAEDTRRHLVEYVQTALKETNILEAEPQAEVLLSAVGNSLRAIRVSDQQKVALWNDALLLYRQVIQQRWVTVDAAGGTIPTPLIIMLILWLTVIFASFGYLTPHNTVVTALIFLVAALLISGTLYLTLYMNTSSSVSNAPFQRALAQLQHPVD